jgi:hypothetical protein
MIVNGSTSSDVDWNILLEMNFLVIREENVNVY